MKVDIVEEVKQRSIIDFIGTFIKLTKVSKGKSKGLCPFHKEKTPSFYVDDDKSFYKCFGCGESGDIINFVSKFKKLDFTSSIEFLAKHFSIEYVKLTKKSEIQNESSAGKLTKFVEFFQASLRKNAQAQHYLLEQRLVSPEMIDFFKIGFCPSKEKIIQFMAENLITNQDAIELGIAVTSSNGIYFLFENRITIAIFNKNNKIIAFGARTIANELPKYINSKETAFFKKSQTLYNIQNIEKNANEIFVVEGYLDAIALRQYKISNNACASLGTALSMDAVKLLFKYSNNITFCFDADLAGINAATRTAIDILNILDYRVNVCFLILQEAKDFDELTKKKDKEYIINLIQNKKQKLEDFIFHQLSKKHSINLNNLQTKIAFEKEIEEITAKILDKIIAKNYKFYFQKKLNELFFASKKNINQKPQIENKNSTSSLINAFIAKNLEISYEDKEMIINYLFNYLNALEIKKLSYFLQNAKESDAKNLEVLAFVKNILFNILRDKSSHISSVHKRNIILTLKNLN